MNTLEYTKRYLRRRRWQRATRALRASVGRVGRRLRGTRVDNYNIPRPLYPAEHAELTKPLLIPVRPIFDQDKPWSGVLIRTGIAAGWSEACGPAKLVPTIHPKRYDAFANRHPTINRHELEVQAIAYRKLVLAEPRFVWAPVGPSSAEWYQDWAVDGFRWERIHLAADPWRYVPRPTSAQFRDVQMAYVGGYWDEKAQAFDQYLRPWENILSVYGNAPWPYRHYRGKIAIAREPELYSSAQIVPPVHSPAGRDIAELTERYFKAPSCRAFCIADHNPAVREVYREDEMLQAESPQHFHELVQDVLDGRIDTQLWCERAYRAATERHLYRHRATQINNLLRAARTQP
ncbi:MAG: glycosyltransferase family 1 protein [Planctomycetia bacterium]|nr:glycosyltransferase family 1 protein [Planctomycetia bacterium]